MDQMSIDDIRARAEKTFTFRELLLFSVQKSTPEELALILDRADAISSEETYLLYDLMEIKRSLPSDDPPESNRSTPPPPLLPTCSKHKVEQPTDRTAESLECAVCRVNRKTEVVIPCGCMILCSECIESCEKNGKLEKCILCRGPIMGIQHTTY